ncbi:MULTISPECIES: DUF2007 domain-containing protein [unclassified Dehalobacter]|uniref:putative signal transducing protein n=1 Tax=unclassified Dehalobacter TaxID=2635733 RepID=UPI000E6CA891|nr:MULTISPECIES: DUF2007 domain-containing protein [unclassified Dehalobacter]RJE46952.1 hypothetical protein A7K50_05495 [Dehalobacter sp. MCB1]TCX50876.1 hypothetical protein C1I38_11750 [Dehalobacter sp. 12DCB1]TCX51588.1 hypothetical protein C1I36_04450 [Dehalobacter sp. 14DCB1]
MKEPNEQDDNVELERWILITEAANEIEADIIGSILDSEGIPFYKKYNEAGDYLRIYMGMTNFGVEIYIPEKLKEKAEGLLNSMNTETDRAFDDLKL